MSLASSLAKRILVDTQDKNTRQRLTIYHNKNSLDNVKILAKVKDINLNSMIPALIREAMTNEQYQKIIHAYIQVKELTL